jgi:hypothetical protein
MKKDIVNLESTALCLFNYDFDISMLSLPTN